MLERFAFAGFVMLVTWAIEMTVGDGAFVVHDLAGLGLAYIFMSAGLWVIRRCFSRFTNFYRPEGQDD